MPEEPVKSTEEIECENLYTSTLVRQNGRYNVSLLLKPHSELGESRAMALRRFHSTERRLEREPERRKTYIEFMREYEQLGHMRKAEPHHECTITSRTMRCQWIRNSASFSMRRQEHQTENH